MRICFCRLIPSSASQTFTILPPKNFNPMFSTILKIEVINFTSLPPYNSKITFNNEQLWSLLNLGKFGKEGWAEIKSGVLRKEQGVHLQVYSTRPIAAELVWYISPRLLQFNEAHLGEDLTLFIPPKSHSMPHTEYTVSQNYSLEFFKVAGRNISALIFGRPRPVCNEGAGSIQAAAHFWK